MIHAVKNEKQYPDPNVYKNNLASILNVLWWLIDPKLLKNDIQKNRWKNPFLKHVTEGCKIPS